MRVFVTGATGFIGSAIVQELISSGHTVLGLARSGTSAARLAELGAEVHAGDLTNVENLAEAAARCDGVIHAAFVHDFSDYADAARTDLAAVTAIADALAGTDKPFVSTSVTVLLQPGTLGTEADTLPDDNPLDLRAPTERAVLEAARSGVRSSVVRLPPSVHGAGDHGFVPALIGIARERGFAGHVGNGANRWPAVHRHDAARLFRLALESAPAGSIFHAVAEQGISMRAVAEVIGDGLGIPTRSIDPADAAGHFGWLSLFVAVDNPVSSEITRKGMGWQIRGPELLSDMREHGYFRL